MEEPKLKLTRKRFTGETTIVSMRITKDMLNEIDSVAEKTGRTRNEFISTALEFALKHLEIVDE